MQLAIIVLHVLLCAVFVMFDYLGMCLFIVMCLFIQSCVCLFSHMFVYTVMCLFIQLHHYLVTDCQHCHAIRLITVFDTHIVSVAAVAVKLHK